MSSIVGSIFPSQPLLTKQELPITATWLGRHAKWVHERSHSQHTFERMCAKVWAVAFTAILGISLIFIPQAFKFQKFLNELRTHPSLIQSHLPVNLDPSQPIMLEDEPVGSYLDGSCDNFFKSSVFKPYLDQLQFILSQQPALKKQINRLIPSPFKDRVLELHQHLSHSPSVFSTEGNRAYYMKFLELVRACQVEARGVDSQTDASFILVRNFLDKFIQDYMKDAIFYEPGMNFLYSRGLSKDLAITQMSDIEDALKQGFDQISHNNCAGIVPGLFDPNLLGNVPYQTFEIQTKNGKTVNVFRCGNIVKDERKTNSFLVDVSIGEQFKLYLDSCQRTDKKHLYVNLMKRCIQNDNETKRSQAIESLEEDYPGTLNVVSLDRNSEFYFQKGQYFHKDNALDFKQTFISHLSNPNFYYWSKDINQDEWNKKLTTVIEHIHTTYFHSNELLTADQRRAFIEFAYCMIIDNLIAKLEPDSCNFSCKSCIDRGGLTNAIMYVYYLVKKQGVIQPEQFNYLLYLTLLPALLVGNRQIQKNYLERLTNFAKVFLGSNQPVAKPFPQNDYIQDITVRRTSTIFDQKQPEAPFDVLPLTLEEQIKWRGEQFVKRKQLPLLSVEQRNQVESRFADKLADVKKVIEGRINQLGIAVEKDVKLGIIDEVSKHYLLTMQYYSPAIVKWMDTLLQRNDDKKLVFLARDGIIFHDVATTLLEKNPDRYPNMSKDKLTVAWLSRKSSKDAASKGRDLVQRYFKQLGIEPNDSILLVDTGCQGTIKKELAPLVKNELECEFSISRNPAIYGFWDNCDFSVQALAFVSFPPEHQEAWANDPKNANDWVEDTHRGNFIGAASLMKKNGVIYPSPSMEWSGKQLVIKETKVENAIELKEFLIRELGRQAITDFAKEISIPDTVLNYDEIKLNLNDLLTRIQKGEFKPATCRHD